MKTHIVRLCCFVACLAVGLGPVACGGADGESGEANGADTGVAADAGSEATSSVDGGCAGRRSLWYPDDDGDGFGEIGAAAVVACESPGAEMVRKSGDCNDSDPAVFPGAAEACDQLDNDCDGTADELGPADQAGETWHLDCDGDGSYAGEVFDVRACAAPGGSDLPGWCSDSRASWRGDAARTDERDCRDTDPSVHPTAPEVCDQVDNDCDGYVDGWNLGCPQIASIRTPSRDFIEDLAVAPSGEIVALGSSGGAPAAGAKPGSEDLFLARYATDGTIESLQLFGTAERDTPGGLAMDGEGNLYIAGWTYGEFGNQPNPSGSDAFVAKLNASGERQWVRQLPAGGESLGLDVVVGTEGGVFLGGIAEGSFAGGTTQGRDAFVATFDADGERGWVKIVGSADEDYAGGLAPAADGGVYLGGSTWGEIGSMSNAGGRDAFLVRFGADGSERWSRMFGSSGSDGVADLALGPAGDVFVTGTTRGSISNGHTLRGQSDSYIAVWGTDGTSDRIRGFGLTGTERGLRISVDGEGHVYVSGQSTADLSGSPNAGGYDGLVLKANEQLRTVWSRLLGSTQDDAILASAVGPEGRLVVGGKTSGDLSGGGSSGRTDGFVSW